MRFDTSAWQQTSTKYSKATRSKPFYPRKTLSVTSATPRRYFKDMEVRIVVIHQMLRNEFDRHFFLTLACYDCAACESENVLTHGRKQMLRTQARGRFRFSVKSASLKCNSNREVDQTTRRIQFQMEETDMDT